MGADETLLVSSNLLDDAAKIKQCFNGEGADITMECSGATASVNLAIKSTRNGGKIALIGIGPDMANISLASAIIREVQFIPINRYSNS